MLINCATRATRYTDYAASEVELCARAIFRQITPGNKEIFKKWLTFFRICLHEKFVSGAVIDEGGEASRFVQGQMISDENGEDIIFLPGEMGVVESKQVFIPGQRAEGNFRPGQMVEGGVFIYGEIIFNARGQPQFLPGIYDETNGNFLPGLVCETSKKDSLFVEGKLFNSKDAETLFVPGNTITMGKYNYMIFISNLNQSNLQAQFYIQ